MPAYEKLTRLADLPHGLCHRAGKLGCMSAKRALCGCALMLAAAGVAAQDGPTLQQDAADVGHTIARDSKQVGQTVARDSKAVGHAVAEKSKEVGHAVAEGTRQTG